MLKKRILASSLASVMALSSVSVVAFADETATAVNTEAVTKAQLKEYIAGFEDFLKTDVYEYGTIQADQIQNAVDYAENVIADANATDEECTAAYQMVKAVYASLEKHTAEELKDLMAEVKDIYDSENILNEDLNDLIYPQDKFDDFVDAYEDADSYVNSGDGRLITDSFVALEKAKGDLKALTPVTKREFRAVLKEFEEINTKNYEYEYWRRGTVSVNPETGVNWTSGDKKKLADAYYVTYGDLYAITRGTSKVALTKNEKHEALNGTGSKTWIATGSYASVAEFVEEKYEEFDKIQTSTKTTDEGIKLAYDAAKEAVAVFNSWKADDTTRAAKANINGLINKYRAQLVRDFGNQPGGIISKIEAAYPDTTTGLPDYVDGKTEWKTIDKITLVLDKDTHLIALDEDGDVMTEVADDEKQTTQTVAKGQDIMKYIPVLLDDVADTTVAQYAFDIADAYATDLYNFRRNLTAYTTAKGAVTAFGAVPAGAGVSAETVAEKKITLKALPNPEGGDVEAADVVLTPYKYDNTASAEDKAKVDAYNDLLKAQQTAYNALSASATKLTKSLADANRTTECPAATKAAATAYVTQKIAYEDFVAAVKLPGELKEAGKEPVAGEVDNTYSIFVAVGGPTEISANAVKDVDGKEILAANTSYDKYKYGETANLETGASLTDATVKPWNDAVDKAKTAATGLADVSDPGTVGSVKNYKAAKVAYEALNGNKSAKTKVDPVDAVKLMAILDAINKYNEADKVQDDTDTEGVDERANAFKYDAYLDSVVGNSVTCINGAVIGRLDQHDIVKEPSGSRNEYTLINRYLTYVLEDMYPVQKNNKYTKSDVKKLISDAYDLCDKTGDSEVFSVRHLDLVEARKVANTWLKNANADKSYKDTNAYWDGANYINSTKAYENLKDVYDKLDTDYKAMPMSYGEIAELIAKTAADIDNGVYANADAVKEALAKVALGLSTLEASLDENYVFDYDREFVEFNRLLVGKNADKKEPNDAEKALKADIDALKKAIEEATAAPETPEVVLGDLTGDGFATPEDAIMIVKVFVGEITLTDAQKAAADFNGDGVVNADDALAVVKAYVGL